MELAIYIKKLLYNHDILVVPGLGALITQYKPAEINQADHTITPPSKYLTFDRDRTQTDGLLAEFISTQRKISSANAEVFIQEEIQAVITRLNEKETILFEGIGYFSKEEGIIRFDRDAEANFLTDSFGLSSVDYKPVELKLTPKDPEIISSHKVKSYTILWLLGGLVAIFVIGLMAYPHLPYLISKFKSSPEKASPIISSQTNLPDSSLAEKDSLPKDTGRSSDLEKFFDQATDKKKALALNSSSKKEKEETIGKPEVKVTYYLIAGSFKTYDRAQVLTKALSKEGYKAEIIQFEQDKYRVSLGEYNNKAKAQAELDKILAAKGAGAVWLLKK